MAGVTYEELLGIQKKREETLQEAKKKTTGTTASASKANSSSSSKASTKPYAQTLIENNLAPYNMVSRNVNNDFIAPVTKAKPTVTVKSYFDDGYDFGDITKTILRTSVKTTNSVANKTSNAISSAFSKIGSNSYSAFDNSLIQKYSSMSLSQIEKELERVEKEEKLFKETNGGKFYNYISKAGASINVGADASGTAMTAREHAEANINTLNDYTREKEILGMLRKQKAIEEHLGDLSKEQLQMLDNIADAEASENIAPIYFASNPDVNQSAYYDAIKPEKAAAEKARATLLEQFKVKNPGMSDEELDEMIDNMVELRKNQKNAEEQEKTNTQMQEYADEHSVAAFLLSRGMNLFSGFTALPELYMQMGNEYGLDVNAPGFSLANTSTAIDEQIQLDHDWKIGEVDAFDLFYKVGTGVVDNVARLAASGGNTAGAAAMMFTQGTTQAIIQGKKKGYSDSKALALGLLDGTFEAVSEKISLDVILKSSGSVLKTLGKSFVAEGSEELTSNWLNRIADEIANGNHSELSKMYEAFKAKGYTDSQALAEVVLSVVGEDVESFVVGGFSGLALGGGNIAVNAVSNVIQQNAPVVLDEKSQQVVDKVVEARIEQEKQDGKKVTKSTEKKIRDEVIRDLQKGYLDKDSIYSEFGGEDYENYKKLKDLSDKNIANGKKVIENLKNVKKRLQAEYDVLYKMKNGEKSDEQKDRQNTLKEQIAEIDGRIEQTESIIENLGKDERLSDLEAKLDAKVYELVKDSKLSETFLEGDRRGQAFVADLTKYDVKQRKVVKKAIESGMLNNSNRTHEFVDMVARISADKGVSFDFTNNEKLKASGFAVEGKIVNGYKTDDGSIAINLQAKKSLNSVVGHEIAHILEGTELYAELENAIKSYAKTKGEYDTRLQDLRELYEGVYKGEDFDEKIHAELVADIVGDYLFTDYDFVRSLTANKNLFQKLRDEVKYFCKIATAGSQEAKELEKVKRNFDRAYQEGAKSDAKVEGTKLSISGVNSKTADKSLLSKAEQLLDSGVDSETVRQETGWYKGYDGQWRYEIDDSKFLFNPDGNVVTPEILRVRELHEKLKNNTLTKDEFDEYKTLYNKVDLSDVFPGTLGRLVEHKELFEAYPQLKDIRLIFDDLGEHTDALYDSRQKVIKINNALVGDNEGIKTVLIHEIQHAIQDIEGFARGSSIEYWKEQRADIVNTLGGARRNLDLWLDDIGYSDFVKKSMQEVVDKKKTIEQHWEDCKEFKQNSKYAEQIANCEREIAEYQQQYDEITNGMTASEQYLNTAGEIEARDAENRLTLNAEQRKNKRPDIDRENVVFADPDIRYSFSEDIDNSWESNYNYDTHYGENLKDTPAYLKPSSDIEWQVFCRSFANKTSNIVLEERNITIFTAADQYLVRADGYMSGRIISKTSVDLYDESGDFYDNYSRSDVPDSYDERKGNRQGNNSNGNEPFENEGADSFYVELDKFIENHPEFFRHIREISSDYRRQIDSDKTAPINEASSKDGVFFDGEKTKFSLSEDSNGRKLTKVQQDYFKRVSPLLKDENGNIKRYYHGTARGDRVGTLFDPERATSGPMAFFTDNPEIAEGYSKSKADTSIAYDSDYDSYETQFRVKINGVDMSLIDAWRYLPMSARARIKDRAEHTHYDFDDYETLIYDEETTDAGGGFSWQLREARGNVFRALNEQWLNSGNLFNEEGKYIDVLKFIGVHDEFKKLGYGEPYYKDPYYREEKVFEVYLNVTNPFHTADVDEEFLADAKDWIDNTDLSIYESETADSDLWDKRSLDPYEWLERLESDIENGTTHAWTSIPDVITDFLKEYGGYDGIVDAGGKHTGYGHQVVIPFYSEQIKNIDNETPTTDAHIDLSLSDEGETSKQYGNFNTYAKDITLQRDIAPTAEAQPVAEDVATEQTAPIQESVAPVMEEPIAPMTEEPVAEVETPTVPEVETPGVTAQEEVAPASEDVTPQQTEATPDVEPYIKKAAEKMLEDLKKSDRGKYTFDPELYYKTGGKEGESYAGRKTSAEITELLDKGYDFLDIENGLKAITGIDTRYGEAVEDIEPILDRMLRNGYTDFISGEAVQPDQDYLNLFAPNQEAVAPTIEENVAPVAPVAPESSVAPEAESPATPVQDDVAPLKETAQPEMPKTEAPKAAQSTPKAETPKAESFDAPVRETKKATESSGSEKIIGEEQLGTKEPVKKKGGLWSDFVRSFVSKDSVFETLALKTKNRALEDKLKMWRNRSDAKAQYFMENGKGDVKSLKSIVDTVQKSGLEKEFDLYMKHRLNVDRMKVDKPVFGYDVTADMSMQTARDLQTKHPEFAQWAMDVYKYNDYLRDMMVDAGIISKETAALWAKQYPNYIPLERLTDDGKLVSGDGVGISAPVKKATGGNTGMEYLLKTMAHRTSQVFKAVAKNDFGVELKNTLKSDAEVSEATTGEAIEDLSTFDEGLLQAGVGGKSPTFTVFENGQRVTFEISEEMFKALQPTSEGLTRTVKPLNVASSLHKKVLTEYNLFFTARNFPKDAQDVIFNSKHAAKTYANMPVAVAELLKGKGKYVTEYWENGGESNTYFDSKENDFFEEDGALKKVLGFVPNGISKVNDFVEAIPRLAEYIASRKSGATIEAAMLDSARVTTDFSDGGDVTKFMNRNGFTFLNASVQGAAQQVRNIREAKAEGFKGIAKLVGKYAISGLPALLFNSIFWDDDEEYEELSEYVKDNYYVIAKYGDGQFVRIPKGRMAAVVQEVADQAYGILTGEVTGWDGAKDSGKAIYESVMNNIAPSNPIENNVIAPIIQAATNKTWYGEDLVPVRLQDVPAREQYDETIDSISKWLGEHTGISPYKINYLLNQYSGFVGDMVLPGLTPEAERGDTSALGNLIAPLKDQFVVDAVIKNRNPSDFFSLSDELEVKANSQDATDEDKLKQKYISSVCYELSDLYKQKREIQGSNLSDDLKYKQVRDIQEQINELAKEGLESFDTVKIDKKYATVGGVGYKLNDKGEWQKITDEQLEKQNDAIDILGITPGQYWNDKDTYDMKAFYPEKYEVLQQEGISVAEYKEKYEKWIHLPNDDFSWAVNNPDKYTFSKVIMDNVLDYRAMTSELYAIRADKDENGNSISGTAKSKKQEYIWGLDIDEVQKYILFKSEYNTYDDHNQEIVDYILGRDDLSVDERKTILETVGFTIDADGTIRD